ncbi:hypothetical protein CC78DRAFT_616813 [Lojkania enalia]|uniref:Methyltransferase domain-containing protein n=1 Tax=Lojkania enalia TaxID=147567 RepID=A0A9P4N688_9PLEO|nr:hypothetical protein CC78DRAFT_616813 [Didymosphaeria enalia]
MPGLSAPKLLLSNNILNEGNAGSIASAFHSTRHIQWAEAIFIPRFGASSLYRFAALCPLDPDQQLRLALKVPRLAFDFFAVLQPPSTTFHSEPALCQLHLDNSPGALLRIPVNLVKMLTQDKNVAWFDEQPAEGQISPAARRLLETYSSVPSDKVIDHVVKIRDRAWEIFPYPCIGQFRFLDMSLNQFAEYKDIVQRLQAGQKLLDMACCFGQEVRQLVADGAPSENIYGCDLRQEYINLGYELFLDSDSLKTKFFTADIFDASSALTELKGQLNMVYAGSFFHLFGYEDQVRVSKIVASLLLPEKGSTIFGRQVGAVNADEQDHTTNLTGRMFRHNVQSIKEMWKDIGNDLGVSFVVDARLLELQQGHLRFHTSDTKRIWFVIRRE